MARISNYRNFSPEMARGPDCHPLTVEYFVHPEEELWTASDAALTDLASRELARMGLVDPATIIERIVVRSAKAYPVIEIGFQAKIDVLRGWLDRFENLLPIGRSGMFKYNNQDHAIATGLLAARTALGIGRFDPWLVNIDGFYQEGSPSTTAGRATP
jgi:protoporphyrinogen oxidase